MSWGFSSLKKALHKEVIVNSKLMPVEGQYKKLNLRQFPIENCIVYHGDAMCLRFWAPQVAQLEIVTQVYN
jgi:hypothetical protein